MALYEVNFECFDAHALKKNHAQRFEASEYLHRA